MEDVAVSKDFDTPPNNVPLPVNRFIGREREKTAVRQLLMTTRLLTLTGAGGSGKTGLALQVATDLLDEFRHGVWWVELAALSDPLLVAQAVASVVGIPERAGCTVTEALSDALRPKHVLLVLDNCEHLLAACVQLIETLLRTCSLLHVLVTSREALTITGETIWLVLPLRVPETYQLPIEGLLTYEAVQLFVERARSVLPSFTLTSENAAAVVQVCRRLDGMPLVIELAAARTRAISVEQIVARLDDENPLKSGYRNADQLAVLLYFGGPMSLLVSRSGLSCLAERSLLSGVVNFWYGTHCMSRRMSDAASTALRSRSGPEDAVPAAY